MAKIGQIRGALLEEAILYLLENVGYKVIRSPIDSIDIFDLKVSRAGLNVKGRGAWHQIDSLAEQHQTPAFLFPLRLLVEAKCYSDQRVGIPVVRNSAGVLKDLSENYFTKTREPGSFSPVRFNYQSAIFSVSGYTKPAIDYALAHNIFLIEYRNIPIIEPVISAIMSLERSSFTETRIRNLAELRNIFYQFISGHSESEISSDYFSDAGKVIIENVRSHLNSIGGSYFGMLQGRWPLHILTAQPLPPDAFQEDRIFCELRGSQNGHWKFIPTIYSPDDPRWFELPFYLPPELAEMLQPEWGDRDAIANMKSQHFSFISLSGNIGGVWRNVRIELDLDWLERYLRENR